MQWAHRVKPWRIRRLYHFAKFGIYDDELLLEVGWGLYARCQDVLTVSRAVAVGEVPCPQCEELVYRPKYYRELKRRAGRTPGPRPSFPCPACRRELTWQECRDTLWSYPKCFDCQWPLDWHYEKDKLTCSRCGIEWDRLKYSRSIGWRVKLPCPHCGAVIRRPKKVQRDASEPDEMADQTSLWGELTCPRCKGSGVHEPGKFRCLQCGHEKAWETYRERNLKRRVERLHCAACGYEFTWQAWRKQYRDQGWFLYVGNRAAVEEFLSKWPRCKAPEEQIVRIDLLLHALHGNGPIAPMFIEGSRTTAMKLLDELARQT